VIGEGIAGVAAIASTILLLPLTRPWYRRWGATDEEAQRSLPGDELVPHARSEFTCAIGIEASAAQVWPWLVQIGCQGAGWYSYDLLDNGGVPSAERIIAEYQHLEIGDEVLLTPAGNMSYPVAMIEPGTALVLSGTMDTRTGEHVDPNDPDLETYFSGANIFFLYELDERTTRLLNFAMIMEHLWSMIHCLVRREPYMVILTPVCRRNTAIYGGSAAQSD
jgi:proline iminopeptidase